MDWDKREFKALILGTLLLSANDKFILKLVVAWWRVELLSTLYSCMDCRIFS